ncbi:hypothetical protein Fmac_009766 [Flemingia macrophylla]|uniref:Leucine-rich repeat domain, L domain-containing protein n=1 Tax=Flemingia macrophylla TaxID=520843 RepID=A0ABD1N167_9FABA
MVSEEITELELCGTAITSFPSISSLPKLTYLYLSDCKEIEKLDLLSKFLKKLKFSHCSSLKDISVVSEEIIIFELCGSSITSFSSISSFPKLTYLDLSDCKEIERLNVHAKSLKELYLNGCSSLKKISVASDELTRLNLEGMSNLESLNVNSRSLVLVVSEEITQLSLTSTAITSFSSISSLPKLTYLDLSDCKKIERLGLHSKSLRKLKLSRCSSLKEISTVSEEIIGFELCSTSITSFSSISSFPKLTYLNLIDCKEIERLDLHSKSLRELYLNGCSSLKEISVTSDELIRLDLDRMSKLESLKVNSRSFINLYLCDCSSIKEISVTSDELTTLALEGRRKLEILNVNSRSLIRLLLKGCSSLKEISVVSKEITKLSLSGTAITSFLSISSFPKLTNLDLEDCKEIKRLDFHSKSLRELKLKGCSSLKEISVALDNLTILDLSGTAITSFLSISSLPKLTNLNLKDCKEIERLDLHSKSLTTLILNGCSSLKEISVALDNLIELDLSGTAITSFLSTSSLPKLTNLYLKYCQEIERLDFHSKSLTTLILNGCSSLKEISVALDNLIELDLSGIAITSFKVSSSLPKLTNLYLKYCKEIERLDFHSKSLTILILNGCSSLKEISVALDNLIELDVSDCMNLVSLTELPTTLYQLRAYNCILLKTEISQGLVLQHMLQSIEHHVMGKFPFFYGYFAFPGNHVIDECQFHTTKCSMSIPGSCLDMSHLSGFIYSIILSKSSIFLHILVSIYQNSVQLWHTQGEQQDNLLRTIIISDHVIFRYQDINEFNRMSKPYDVSKEVEIKFQLNGEENVTKGFGVFPIYATASGFKLQISESQSVQLKEQPSTLKRRMT